MEAERVRNPRQQGDIGEASAVEWLVRKGALVLVPFGHSPDYDLVAEIRGRLLRIQVKTSTQVAETPSGKQRLPVTVRTCGGNRSWSGVSKTLDSSAFDHLFVLTRLGRRWFIPAAEQHGLSVVTLGGPKYAQYEIEPAAGNEELPRGTGAALESPPGPGEYPSGQRMAAVNRPAQPSQVRILPPPLPAPRPVKPSNYERAPGRRGEAVINQKRRITLPQQPFFEAGFVNEARVRVRCDGPGRLVLEQIELPDWAKRAA